MSDTPSAPAAPAGDRRAFDDDAPMPPSGEPIDRITWVAAALLDAPSAFVGIKEPAGWSFPSTVGINRSALTTCEALCERATSADDIVLIADASTDLPQADRTTVPGTYGVGFFAGGPLLGPDGTSVGVLGVFDRGARAVTAADRSRLRAVTSLAEDELRAADLRRAGQRFEAVLRAARRHCIFATDPGGVLTVFSTGASQMLGWTAGELVGRATPARFFAVPQLGEDAAAAARGLRALSDGHERECLFRHRDGHVVPVALTVTSQRRRTDPEDISVLGVAIEVTDHLSAEDTARLTDSRLRGLVQLISDGIVLLDPGGRITWASASALELLDQPLDRLVGTSVFEIVDPADRTLARASFATTRETPGPRPPLELRLVPDAVVRDVEVVANNLLDDPAVGGVVLTVRDVTERRAVERMQDRFVSVVSHELRTPLTSIIGALGLLAGGVGGELSDQARQLIDIAHRNGDVLLRLVNDILDFERLQSGRVVIESRPVDLRMIVDDACAIVNGAATVAGVRLEPRSPHVEVVVDPGRTAQTLTNLIANAVKFSDRGASVQVVAAVDDERVRFDVRDSGRGIPADQLAVVFERFAQVDAQDQREQSGTGLGLAIAREIVERQGGRIWAESDLGQGSTFSFWLPRRPVTAGVPT